MYLLKEKLVIHQHSVWKSAFNIKISDSCWS